ncbi:hypothetical protein D9V86_06270 [Bacteroidetes/Chlorobi group bacterium ChocPot_Mid]|nr:MAG: hypothetical protein D9V86_06270 [Bacteroidetes/Chlorobi group bacterium ChocPot_Mid]
MLTNLIVFTAFVDKKLNRNEIVGVKSNGFTFGIREISNCKKLANTLNQIQVNIVSECNKKYPVRKEAIEHADIELEEFHLSMKKSLIKVF